MTRLYKQATRSTDADDGNERTDHARLTSTDLLYRLDLQRQVAPGSERTFGQWAIQALIDDEKNAHDPKTSKQDEKNHDAPDTAQAGSHPRRRVFIVSANDEYNFCQWCGHRIPGTARARHDRASNTTIIECPHCRRELEYILR